MLPSYKEGEIQIEGGIMKKFVAKKSFKIFLFCFFVVNLCFLSGCGGGGTSGGPSTVDISDTWIGDHTDANGIKVQFSFAPTQTGDTITGLINWSDSSSTTSTFTGTISGLDITLSWTQAGSTINLAGTVSADGTTMSGTWSSSDGTSGTWQATRSHVVAS